MIQSIWLTKLLLAHLVTDFMLQPKSWVDHRNANHFSSSRLYLHGLITGLFAWMMIGWQYWLVALVIWITHTITDGWKSYKANTVTYFLADQFIHLLIILGCWYFTFYSQQDILQVWQKLNTHEQFWKVITAIVFLTVPSGILIGQFTKQWRDKIADADSLANAGKWIGIIERIVIFIFVMQSQYSAIGLLVAAKGIIRFNEKDRPETKTEYLVIGTLMSIGISVITGCILKLLE